MRAGNRVASGRVDADAALDALPLWVIGVVSGRLGDHARPSTSFRILPSATAVIRCAARTWYRCRRAAPRRR